MKLNALSILFVMLAGRSISPSPPDPEAFAAEAPTDAISLVMRIQAGISGPAASIKYHPTVDIGHKANYCM